MLVDISEGKEQIKCSFCKETSAISEIVNEDEIVVHKLYTHHKPWRDQSASGKQEQRPTVNEVCPECGHGKMYFWTKQLRSVDEGQTVFYECVECQ